MDKLQLKHVQEKLDFSLRQTRCTVCSEIFERRQVFYFNKARIECHSCWLVSPIKSN